MKVFISMGMRDCSQEEIIKRRDEIFEEIKKKAPSAILIDSVIAEEAPDTGSQGLWYLGKSFELMAEADLVCFAEGWTDYRGCQLEHRAAVAYEKFVIVR